MSEAPTNTTEYLRRFFLSQKIEGYGLDTTIHMPCPFCAAPDWLVHKLICTHEALESGATCKECERSAKAVFTETKASGVTAFEMVQTAGPDQPEWLQPKMRRV